MIYFVVPISIAFVAAGSAARSAMVTGKPMFDKVFDAVFDALLYSGAASFCFWVAK